MSKNKNPLQRCDTGAGEDLQTGLCQSFYFTAKRTPFPGGNSSLTGWSGRMVRLAIERERRHGVPILSDNANGYYLPGNSAERAQFV